MLTAFNNFDFCNMLKLIHQENKSISLETSRLHLNRSLFSKNKVTGIEGIFQLSC